MITCTFFEIFLSELLASQSIHKHKQTLTGMDGLMSIIFRECTRKCKRKCKRIPLTLTALVPAL